MRPAEARLAFLLVVAASTAAVAALAQSGAPAQALPTLADGPGAWAPLLGTRPRVDLGGRAIVLLRTPSLAQGGSVDAELAAQARVAARFDLRPELRFTRVLDAFSARVDPGLAPLVERDADVAGVYPVRAAYPAYAATSAGDAATVLPPPGGLDGRGVRVALLAPRAGPLADVLARVAPGAVALPIAVGARSDEVLAGLERAVAAHARVAVVAVTEPYAGFADSPESRAVAGAAALGTLVVAAAGNDGSAAGPGDLSAWAAAPDALAVEAADTRPAAELVQVSLGGWRGTVPLAGGPAPSARLALPVAEASGSGPLAFFTPAGGSLVAGRAVVVHALAAVAGAARAGATAVLLAGVSPPSGGVASSVPVVALPAGAGGGSIALAPAGRTANGGRGRLAPFSSTGPGAMLAAGVGLPTRGGTVSGTGAAAAVAAGRAAIAAQATPSLTAAGLRAALAAGDDPAPALPRVPLLRAVRLASHAFASADTAPALLAVDAGRVVATTAGPELVPLARLDVELWQGGRDLGTLARLRDVLPGRYTFGLTGRGPAGAPLPPGEYAVRVVAAPVEGGNPSQRFVRFFLR